LRPSFAPIGGSTEGAASSRIARQSFGLIVRNAPAGRERHEVVVAEVGLLLHARGHDDAVELDDGLMFMSFDVTVLAVTSILSTLPSSTRTFFCSRRIRRVAGAISPTARMPVATW